MSPNRNCLNASRIAVMSIVGSGSAGPIQYRLLSPNGSCTTQRQPRYTNEKRSSLTRARLKSETPATDVNTRRMIPNDQGKAFEISKYAIVPSSRMCGYVFN